VQQKLHRELRRLKTKVGLAGHLSVKWCPEILPAVHGKVIDSMIVIHDQQCEEALRTLRHEFVEYILTHEYLTPKLFEAKAHRRADALVDILTRLI
jgi:hypothetical protein